jgi:hypothetical protein
VGSAIPSKSSKVRDLFDKHGGILPETTSVVVAQLTSKGLQRFRVVDKGDNSEVGERAKEVESEDPASAHIGVTSAEHRDQEKTGAEP